MRGFRGLNMQTLNLCFLLVFMASFTGSRAAGKTWAVLIQGSSRWYNYFSTASVCHAFQTLKRSGIPEENIIVMMADDIANNRKNPEPGVIRNSPNGSDVYPGVGKDYLGSEVTKYTFLAVLRGDQEAIFRLIGRKGKVVESGPEDNIFVYFTDHGGHGTICFDHGPYLLYARELNDTLTGMFEGDRYNKMVVYMESCKSGSMFDNVLSPNINVYAMTATDPYSTAYLIFKDAKLGTAYGIEFECNWLGDTDFFGVKDRTFQEQFEDVKKGMTASVPFQYGDMSIAKDSMSEFFHQNNKVSAEQEFAIQDDVTRTCSHPDSEDESGTWLPLGQENLYWLRSRLERETFGSKGRADIEIELAEEEKLMANTKQLYMDIAQSLYSNLSEDELSALFFDPFYDEVRDWDCYEAAVDILSDACPAAVNPYAMDKMVSLIHLCNKQEKSSVLEAVISSATKMDLCTPMSWRQVK